MTTEPTTETGMDRLCVYCGSSPGHSPEYVEAAVNVAEALVEREIGLVYGGASVGVMGALADAVLEEGGEAVGIIPESLEEKEITHPGLTDLHVVESMHARKRLMVEQSEGFVALPGGLGTVEEMFEVLTWAQLGFHDNPCGFLNVAGYYDALTEFLDHAVSAGFVKPLHREMIIVESAPHALLKAFATHEPPQVEKWIDGTET